MADQIKPTDLSQFIRLDGCQRYLHFTLHPETKNALHARYNTRPVMLPQLLQDEGERFEQDVAKILEVRGVGHPEIPDRTRHNAGVL